MKFQTQFECVSLRAIFIAFFCLLVFVSLIVRPSNRMRTEYATFERCVFHNSIPCNTIACDFQSKEAIQVNDMQNNSYAMAIKIF